MKPIPSVKKTGALWTGAIVDVLPSGRFLTNIPEADVRPLIANAKVWFELGKPSVTMRGIHEVTEITNDSGPIAVSGSSGMIEIFLPKKNLETAIIGLGTPVSVHFRTYS